MRRPDYASNEPVTVVISWTVKEGKEHLFKQIMHKMHTVARTFPGHAGVTTLKSSGLKGSFQTVLRFDNAAHLGDWYYSPVRQQLMKQLESVAHSEATSNATGLETWFEIPGQSVAPPPKWKMALTTFIAIYPLSLFYGVFLTPYITDWPVAVRALVLPILAPTILTYLFMPLLTQHVLKRWLYTSAPSLRQPH